MKSIFLLAFFLTVLISCHKDTDIITIVDKPDPPPVLITTQLVSLNDTNAIASALASQVFSGQSAPFSQVPFIVSEGEMINRDFELVRLETKDHLEFYSVKTLIENDVNYLHWAIPSVSFISGNTAMNAEVNLSTEIRLIIPANSILRSDGSVYNGVYKMAFAILDPASSAAEAIPSFTGIRDHQHVALQFQHCIYINVLGESNEKLHFANSAYIQIPPASSQEIWKFNTEKSAWVNNENSTDESVIQLGSSLYYGIATADPLVRMTGSFSLNGKLTPHLELRISYGNTKQLVYTTNSGAWAALVPAGINCTIETSMPCGSKYSQELLTHENTFNLPITVNQPTCVNASYNGTMRNNNAGKLMGIIEVNGAQPNFYYADDPDFSFNVPTCLGFSNGLRGIDIATGQTGPIIYWEAADSVNVFSVFACEEARDEYLSLKVSNDSKMYWDLKTGIQQSRLIIEEGSDAGELDLKVLISGMQEGNYQNTELNILFEDPQLGAPGYSLYCPTSPEGCGFTKFVITHFPSGQGQWIRGYFEGSFWIKTFHPLTAGYRPVKGEFQVFRDF